MTPGVCLAYPAKLRISPGNDLMSVQAIDPSRYHETIEAAVMNPIAIKDPVCLYLETTNRCNLLCTTCPRTYADLEPQADMSWGLFTRIVDQVPNIARVVLHGVGEPMLVKDLPRMIRYLKDRGAYVLFNTNGTVLTAEKGRELCVSGLDELRVSLDAADARTFLLVRGKDYFNRIVRNVRAFTELQAREGLNRPRVSLWLTGLKETIAQLSDFVRLAHEIGVKEVYLQRLVFCEEAPARLARPDQALFERLSREEAHYLAAAETLAAVLGISFNASGATEPGESLECKTDKNPWSLCRRPWAVMYFTANGRALPCCIAPFSQKGYENYTLGDATQETLRDIWNGRAYRHFREALQSDTPPNACASCGLRWSL
jgi:MoaA/NifB/PqqE/SkfB family radical SAM enzyme